MIFMEKRILQSQNNNQRFLMRKMSHRVSRGAWLLATAGILSFGMVSGCGNNGGGGATTGGGGVVVNPETALATVGDTTLNKSDMYSLLEANYGASALTQLIDYTLLMQKAKSEGIEVSEDDVQKELDKRAKETPAMAAVQKKGGATLDALKRQVRLQLTIDRLLTKDIKVDPKAYDAWLKKNQSKYAVPERLKIGVLFASTQARAEVLAQQLKGGKSFADLVKAQKATSDPIAASSVADTTENAPPTDPNGGYLAITELPPEMKTALAKLQKDQTSSVIKLSGARPAFVILKLLDRKEGVAAKAEDAKPQLEYKLEQVARNIVKENPSNPNFEQTLTQVEQALQQQKGSLQPPTNREVLDYINQTAMQKLLSDLRTAGKVEIKDPMYKEVADNYKAAPTPAPAAGAPGGAVPPAGAAPAADNAAGEAPAVEAPAAEAPAAENSAAQAPAANAAR
ncbi:MAG: peptidyl-prolyl cis-trans isomerase [Gemmatimonadaceae bacterium]